MPGMGKWFKYYRMRLGLSQPEVAKELGITAQSYQKYESDERNPKHERKAELSKIFKVSYASITFCPAAQYRDMLNRVARHAVLGNADVVDLFWHNKEYEDDVVFSVLDTVYKKWENDLESRYTKLYSTFIGDRTTFQSLEFLAKIMRQHELVVHRHEISYYIEAEPLEVPVQPAESSPIKAQPASLDPATVKINFDDYKTVSNVIDVSKKRYRVAENKVDLYQVMQAAFCVSFMRYILCHSFNDIIEEVVDHMEDGWIDKNAGDTAALVAVKYFGAAIVTPYAHVIGDVLDCVNSIGTMEDFERLFFYWDSAVVGDV